MDEKMRKIFAENLNQILITCTISPKTAQNGHF